MFNYYNWNHLTFFFSIIKVSETEDVIYCGTTSGDILKISYPGGSFRSIGPEKNKYSLGVSSLQCLKNGDILAGSGDGKIMLLDPIDFKIKKSEFFVK